MNTKIVIDKIIINIENIEKYFKMIDRVFSPLLNHLILLPTNQSFLFLRFVEKAMNQRRVLKVSNSSAKDQQLIIRKKNFKKNLVLKRDSYVARTAVIKVNIAKISKGILGSNILEKSLSVVKFVQKGLRKIGT